MSRKNISMRESVLSNLIDEIHKEKGIPREQLIEIIEEAVVHATKKKLGAHREFAARFDPYNATQEQELTIFEYKTIVEEVEDPDTEISLEDAEMKDETTEFVIGDEIGIPLDIHPQELGRIAATNAKQFLRQKIRQAERDVIFNEFNARKGEIITGIVRRYDKDNVILELGKAEAILRKRHQIKKESYRPGDSLQAYLLDINNSSRQPPIELSRTDKGLVIKLFEMGVPEIRQGLVSIVSCARVPGERAKIAVRSHMPDVDPVGACVGLRGTRVQEVVRSLNNESIDIVPWSEDPLEYVRQAIAPATMSKGILYYDNQNKVNVEVIVPDLQLSKAIGKQGQNVRLASQLTGFKIDIFPESKYAKNLETAKEELQQIEGLTAAQIETLLQHRYFTAQQVYDEEAVELMEVLEISEADAETIINNAATALDRITEAEKQARLSNKQ